MAEQKKAETYPKIEDIFGRAVVSASKSMSADMIKSNVEYERHAGMRPRIVRSSDGKCCEWCSSVAGEYYADQAPDDIYKRHDNCTCTVTYISEKGYQDAHTKKWIEQDEIESRQVRIKADENYTRINYRQRTGYLSSDEYAVAKDLWNRVTEVEMPWSEKEHIFEEFDNNLTAEEKSQAVVQRSIGNYTYTAVQLGHNQYKIYKKVPTLIAIST